MLTTVRGIYENGQIQLQEKPVFKTKKKVIVVFEEEDIAAAKQEPTVHFGLLKGKVSLPNEFNEPLDDLNEYMF